MELIAGARAVNVVGGRSKGPKVQGQSVTHQHEIVVAVVEISVLVY
jgi:hypothetical protein